MKIVGFKYNKETKIVTSLIFKDKEKFINNDETSLENVFIANENQYDIMQELFNIINDPEELIYLESSLNISLNEILAKKIYYDKKGHLSNLNKSEVIDIEGLESINVSLDLFKQIEDKPHKLNLKKTKENNFYGLNDISLFIEYNPLDVETLNLDEVINKTNKSLAETKIELMEQKNINNELISEIANLKIELMQVKGGI
ncbi:hypothetical protein [Clostridium perfringens]|uniref:Uncharacterized protein n=1 Tax=Clostridium perfringens E str. JGS1987 TaxID=451755 RepID=B1BPR9_CLOPF|nr:hypothetical protein [Clostridium perfringens]EDT16383.1 conserved hypothetical protein [Clostridium perfringens E str. JGS1987]